MNVLWFHTYVWWQRTKARALARLFGLLVKNRRVDLARRVQGVVIPQHAGRVLTVRVREEDGQAVAVVADWTPDEVRLEAMLSRSVSVLDIRYDPNFRRWFFLAD